VLGQLDLLAPEGGEREVGNLVRKLIRGHACSPLIFWAFGCVFSRTVWVARVRVASTLRDRGGRRTFSGVFLT
jgi:hypothetical protein